MRRFDDSEASISVVDTAVGDQRFDYCGLVLLLFADACKLIAELGHYMHTAAAAFAEEDALELEGCTHIVGLEQQS